MRPIRAAALVFFLSTCLASAVGADPVNDGNIGPNTTEGGIPRTFTQATLQANDTPYVTATSCTGAGAGTCASGASPSCVNWVDEIEGTCSVDGTPCTGSCTPAVNSCVGESAGTCDTTFGVCYEDTDCPPAETCLGGAVGSCNLDATPCTGDVDCVDTPQACIGYSAEVPGTCTYGATQPISACSITSPVSAEVACMFNATSVTVTMQSDWGGTFSGTYSTFVDGVTRSATFSHTRNPVSDGGTVSHMGSNTCLRPLVDGSATTCAREDTTAQFTFSVTENDTSNSDAGETLTEIRVIGVPNDVTFSVAGLTSSSCGAGCVRLTGASFNTVYTASFNAPQHYATTSAGNSTYSLNMTAYTQDGAAAAAPGLSEEVRIEFQEVVDPATVSSFGSAIGPEDTNVRFTGTGLFAVVPVDTDGSQTVEVFVQNVPSTGTVSPAGVNVSPGVFRFTPAQVNAGLSFRWNGSPNHSDANVPLLSIRVRTQENFSMLVSEATFNKPIQVNAVADTPNLSVTGAVVTNEDTSAPLTITPSLVDGDGSEMLTVMITGVDPAAGSLSAGMNMGGGSWMLSTAQLAGLMYVPVANSAADDTITVRSVATETRGVCSNDATLECTVDGDCGGVCNRTQAMSAPQNIVVTVNAVADGANVSHVGNNTCNTGLKDGNATVCTNEDTLVSFTVTGTLIDTTPVTEVISEYRVENVPTGAIVDAPGFAETSCGAGCVSIEGPLPVGQPVTINFTPPPNLATVSGSNNSFALDITGFTTDEGSVEVGAAAETVIIEVHEIADLPTITGPADGIFIGVEDMTATISGPGLFTAVLNDLDGSEQLTILISGVPANATISPGIDQNGGVWQVTPVQLNAGVTFRYTATPDHLDTNVDLTFTATATENYTFATLGLLVAQASATATIELQMNGVADTPTLMAAMNQTTDEDVPVQLNFTPALVDMDMSEELTVVVSNLPTGVTLDVGTVTGPGEYTIDVADLPATLTPILHDDTNIDVDVQAFTRERVGTCTTADPPIECNVTADCMGAGACVYSTAASAVETITLQVTAVADMPNFNANLGTINANEGQNVSIPITASRVDDDGSETCTVTITWDDATPFVEPEMVGSIQFTAGSSASATSWTVPCANLGGFQLDLPPNGHGNIEFCATASTVEFANNDTATTAEHCFFVNIANTNEVCDDGFEDPSEECDDGQYNANAPNACRPGTCVLPTCGDDIQDNAAPWNEECDDGGNNSDTQPDACRNDCSLPSCGDGVQDMFEGCDDGNNGINTDSCLDGCLPAQCGDGFVWAGVEECDTGLSLSDTLPDACRTTCLNAHCTDGVLDTGEACDDGNANDNDACPTTCELPFCGDGFTFMGMEECDQGANNSDVQPDTCRTSCVLPFCGDVVVDTGEQCDDGNTVNEDPCVNSCDLNVCGDGFVDLTSEECDDGPNNSNSMPDACRPGCSNPFCGDGVVDSGEGCDLGANNNDNDPNGCKTNCALPGCGDGVVGPGEACDDGPNNSDTNPDACRTTCTLARCGDAVVDMNEVCDDGIANSNNIPNSCRRNCMPPSCGDGVVDTGETCDNGANNSDTTPGACRTSCVVASCGDNVVDPGEACDNGAANSDSDPDACRTTCVVATCGDGVIDAGEICDDGAANGTDPNGCETDCTLPPSCGDGTVDEGEECDDGALNSDTESDACRVDCTNPICGDNVVDSGEECDEGFDSTTCSAECVAIGGDDMGTDPDMGGDMGDANNEPNNAPNAGPGPDAGPDAGGEEDMGGDNNNTGNNGNGGTTPNTDDGCCRTIRRAEGDSGAAGWLALLAALLVVRRRR